MDDPLEEITPTGSKICATEPKSVLENEQSERVAVLNDFTQTHMDTASVQQTAESAENTMHNENADEEKKKPKWKTPYSDPPPDDDASATSGWWEFFLKVLKLSSYIITFALNISLAVVSKLSFHLMAGMTRPDKNSTACPDQLRILDRGKHYHSSHGLTSPERIAWLWVLFFVLCVPDVCVLLKSINVCLFKQHKLPKWYKFHHTKLIVATNTCEVIGLGLFSFLVLPYIDITSGLIFTNCICLVPSGCLLLRTMQLNPEEEEKVQEDCEERSEKPKNEGPKFSPFHFYLLAFVLQIIVLVAWPFVLVHHNNALPSAFGVNNPRDEMLILIWALPLSAILISLGHWENFVPESGTGFMSTLAEIKKIPIVSKYAIYSFISVWKIVLYFVMFLATQSLIAWHHDGRMSSVSNIIDKLFTDFGYAFNTHPIDFVQENSILVDIKQMNSDPWAPIIVGLTHIFSAMLLHRIVIFVCQIGIQPFSFGLAFYLALPATVSIMNALGSLYMNDVCIFAERSKLMQYIFWNVHYNLFTLDGFWNKVILLLWFGSFIAKAITVSHVWISSNKKLCSSDELFVLPFYSSAMIEQSLMLNQRIDKDFFSSMITGDNPRDEPSSGSKQSNIGDNIRVYACATVWHETDDELFSMLKSIMRMDQDQACRKLAVNEFRQTKSSVDYYDLETHLFVDDAFLFDKTKTNRFVNKYVMGLIDVLNKAATNIHQTNVKLKPPRIFTTPYGGRLEWILPGRTMLIAHLKDKLKVRDRKRWSQVMYMYYLLSYKIYEKIEDPAEQEERLANTYILTLDADINFRPDAVLKLIDLMRKNKDLGAACGRIHPIGSGPMAWYQVFEYAVSHWLQKTAEHVFGCVTCAPGCFSLFRASVLAAPNVMHRYTTESKKAINHVQYDQGEDRWLCTLILQQGYRIEYSSTAEAFTNCPEGFIDYFIQRRRWVPSTLANTAELLQNSKHTVKKNDNISLLFILYQTALMFGSILSPGTIFLMLVGALNTAFSMPTEHSFYINVVPILTFIIVCFTFETNFQLFVAQIFTAFYVMLMLTVLVSTVIKIKENALSPSVLFFVGMISVFVISATIHPQEFYCIFSLPVYMLTIPTMYLLLTIYSITNMNIVAWGTREAPKIQTSPEGSTAAVIVKDNGKQGIISDISNFFGNSKFCGLNCTCCSSITDNEEINFSKNVEKSINDMQGSLQWIKKRMKRFGNSDHRRRPSQMDPEAEPFLQHNDDDLSEAEAAAESLNKEVHKKNKPNEEPKTKSVRIVNDKWVTDITTIYKESSLKVEIEPDEEIFWVDFIEEFLKPPKEDEERKKEVENELIELRNKVSFAFGFINIIFVLLVYLLQINKATFSFQLHIKGQRNGTEVDDDTGREIPTYAQTDVDLDPIGTVLIVFFGAILLLQFVGMFIHRFESITHLLACTDAFKFFKVREEHVNDSKAIQDHAIYIVMDLMNKKKKDKKKSSEAKYFDIFEYFIGTYVKPKGADFNEQKSNDHQGNGENDSLVNVSYGSQCGNQDTASSRSRHSNRLDVRIDVHNSNGRGHSGRSSISSELTHVEEISTRCAVEIIQNAINIVDSQPRHQSASEPKYIEHNPEFHQQNDDEKQSQHSRHTIDRETQQENMDLIDLSDQYSTEVSPPKSGMDIL